MKRILVPTDFSPQAFEACKVAANIAERTQATIYLLHVIDIPTSVGPSGTGVVQEDIPETIFLLKRAKQQFAALVKDPIFKKVTRVIEAIDFDSTYGQIAKKADEHEIDLIVMGSHGSRGMKEFFIGSNTERVTAMAKCPVLTVKGTPAAMNLEHIVFASDFSKEADDAYNKLRVLPDIYGSKVHLLKVNTPLNFERSGDTTNMMHEFAKRNSITNYSVSIFNDYSEEEGMEHYASDVNAQIIALGSHGRSGLSQMVKGNIAADLVNHSERMILSVSLRAR